MAKSKKKVVKKTPPLTQIFTGIAILLIVVLIAAIFTSRNIRTDRTVLVSSAQENVLLRHYMYFLNSIKYQYENEWAYYYGMTAEDIAETWKTVEDGLTFGDHLKTMALETTKNVFTEYHIAKQNGFVETPLIAREAQASIDYTVQQSFSGSNTPNTDFFKAYGLTIDEMKQLEIYISLVNEWRNDVYGSIEISDAQALAYFEAFPEEFETVTARHILISTENAQSDEDFAAAEELANDLLQQIIDGADIGELAALYSDDPGSAEYDGEYTFGRGEMVEEFEDWAFSAAVGDKGVVQTDFGFHVIQLMEGPPSFADIKESLIDKLIDEEGNRYIDEAIAAAGIVWSLNESAYKKIKVE